MRTNVPLAIVALLALSACNEVPATVEPDAEILTSETNVDEQGDEILAAISREMEKNQRGDGISNAQDFDDVSVRLTIHSDAERLKELRKNRVEFWPEALPEPPETTIANYALSVDHPVGSPVHERFAPFSTGSLPARCARYFDAHEAQRAFLDAGGPQRDRMGLDADGDGYACDWTPELFRAMVK